MDPAVQVGEALRCQLAEEVLCLAGELRLRVTGTSMLPSVWPGDILHIRRQDTIESLPGDIVLVRRQGRLCAHRVVKKISKEGEPYWITRGDSTFPPPESATRIACSRSSGVASLSM